MRRTLVFVAPFALAALAFACEDDPSAPPAGALPEAGGLDANRPATDASLPDTSQPDVPIVPKVVTVVVGSRNGPRAGVTVVFHDASGAPIQTVQTGADGKAVSAGVIPAMATALLGKDTSKMQLLTWTGVAGGDELVAVEEEEDSFVGNYEVELPSLLVDAGGGTPAQNYTASAASCEGGGSVSPITLGMESRCVRPQNAILVRAFDGSGAIVGHSFKKNNPAPADGGIVPVTGLPAWAGFNTFTLTVANPPGVSGVQTRLYEIASGAAIPNYSSFYIDGANEAKFRVAPGFADGYQAEARAPGGVFANERTLIARTAPNMTGVTLDFQDALPELTNVAIDETDKLRPSISWTAASTLAGSDGGVLRTGWFDYPNERFITWSIVVPPSAQTGSVKTPALPAPEAAAFLPQTDAGEATWQDPEATFAEADAIPDYPAFKKAQAIVVAASNQSEGVFLPANGAARTTQWSLGRGGR